MKAAARQPRRFVSLLVLLALLGSTLGACRQPIAPAQPDQPLPALAPIVAGPAAQALAPSAPAAPAQGALLFAPAVDQDGDPATNPAAGSPVGVTQVGQTAAGALRYGGIGLAVEVLPATASLNPAGTLVTFRVWDERGQVDLTRVARADAWGAATAELLFDDLHLAGRYFYQASAPAFGSTPVRSFQFDPARPRRDVRLGAAHTTLALAADGRLTVDVASDPPIAGDSGAVTLTAVRLVPAAQPGEAPGQVVLPSFVARRLDDHQARAELYVEPGNYMVAAHVRAAGGVVEAQSAPAFVEIGQVYPPAVAHVEALAPRDDGMVLARYRTPDDQIALLPLPAGTLPEAQPAPTEEGGAQFSRTTRVGAFTWRTDTYRLNTSVITDDGKKRVSVADFSYDPLARSYEIVVESLLDHPVEDQLTVEALGPNQVVIHTETVPIVLDPGRPLRHRFVVPTDRGEPSGLRVTVHDPSVIQTLIETIDRKMRSSFQFGDNEISGEFGTKFELRLLSILLYGFSVDCRLSGACNEVAPKGLLLESPSAWAGIITDSLREYFRKQFGDLTLEQALQKPGSLDLALGSFSLKGTLGLRGSRQLFDPGKCPSEDARAKARDMVKELGDLLKEDTKIISEKIKGVSNGFQEEDVIVASGGFVWLVFLRLKPSLKFKIDGGSEQEYSIFLDGEGEIGGEGSLRVSAFSILRLQAALAGMKRTIVAFANALEAAAATKQVVEAFEAAEKQRADQDPCDDDPPPPNGAPDDRRDAFQGEPPAPAGASGQIALLQQQIAAAERAGLHRAAIYYTLELRRLELEAFEGDMTKALSNTVEIERLLTQSEQRVQGLMDGTVAPTPGQTVTETVELEYMSFVERLGATPVERERAALLDAQAFAERQYSGLLGQELELQRELRLMAQAVGVGVLDSGLARWTISALGSAGIAALPVQIVPGRSSSGLPESRMYSPYEAPPVLIVPSGGLHRIASSRQARDWLDAYVSSGGTLIALVQADGADWEMLPGGLVRGLGYNQDILCRSDSVKVQQLSPWVAGLSTAVADIQVDGSFTAWPPNATVLLERTTGNQKPAMIEYPYGNGRVVATAAYPDFAGVNGMQSRDDVLFARSLFSQAYLESTGETLAATVEPGQPLNLKLTVTNTTALSVTQVAVWGDYYDGRVSESWRWKGHRPNIGAASAIVPLDPPLLSGQARQVDVRWSAPGYAGIFRAGYFLGSDSDGFRSGGIPGPFYRVLPGAKSDLVFAAPATATAGANLTWTATNRAISPNVITGTLTLSDPFGNEVARRTLAGAPIPAQQSFATTLALPAQLAAGRYRLTWQGSDRTGAALADQGFVEVAGLRVQMRARTNRSVYQPGDTQLLVTTLITPSAVLSGATLRLQIKRTGLADQIEVRTLAGAPPWADGTGHAARLDGPKGIALGPGGAFAMWTDGYAVRSIDMTSLAVTTMAGTAQEFSALDGVGGAARFRSPEGIAVSADGRFALVADDITCAIRRIDITTSTVTTLAGSLHPWASNCGTADGTGAAARFGSPKAIAVSADGSFALVADQHAIRRVDVATGAVTTLAGVVDQVGSADGSGPAARFNFPNGIALSPDGTFALVADTVNYTIRRVDVATGAVTTLAGLVGADYMQDGIGPAARFDLPEGIAISPNGTFALVTDGERAIRRIQIATGAVTTLAGSGAYGWEDGVGTAARFDNVYGITISPDGTFALVTDDNVLRRIALPGAQVTTIAGGRDYTDSTGPAARFFTPDAVALSPDGSFALVADSIYNTIRRIETANGAVSTLAGTRGLSGLSDGTGAAARFDIPHGLAISSDGTFALVADTDNRAIRRIQIATGEVTTLAGNGEWGGTDGIGSAARFGLPEGIAISPDDTFALVADNTIIRRVNLATHEVTTIAGQWGVWGGADGIGAAASFDNPNGIAISADGSFALVADFANHAIRRIDLATRAVTTVAGLAGESGYEDGVGDAARFSGPEGVTISPDGSFALVADTYNNTIRRIDLATRAVTTVAGRPFMSPPGGADGAGETARFNQPVDIAISADGTLTLVADSDNGMIRTLGATGAVVRELTLPVSGGAQQIPADFSALLSDPAARGPMTLNAALFGSIPAGAEPQRRQLLAFSVQPFGIQSAPQAPQPQISGLTATPAADGRSIDLAVELGNSGAAGEIVLTLDGLDRAEERRVAIATGDQTLDFTLAVPPGLLAGTYSVGVRLGDQERRVDLALPGPTIALRQQLDAESYAPNSQATWTIAIEGQGSGTAAYGLILRYGSQESRRTISIAAGQTLQVPWTFNTGPAGDRATVLVTNTPNAPADSRYALAIDSRWVAVREDARARLVSDKERYQAGETVHLTLEVDQPLRTASVLAPEGLPSPDGPMLWSSLRLPTTTVAPGSYPIALPLPATLATGRYLFRYRFDDEEHTLPIDVFGVTLTSEATAVDLGGGDGGAPGVSMLAAGRPLTITTRLRLDRPVADAEILAYALAPDGHMIELGSGASFRRSLPAGPSLIAVGGHLSVTEPGAYQIVLKVRDHASGALLGGDAALVDIGGATIAALRTDRGLYTPGQAGTGSLALYGTGHAAVRVTTSGGDTLLQRDLVLDGYQALTFALPTGQENDEVISAVVTDDAGLVSRAQAAYRVAAALDITAPIVSIAGPAEGTAFPLAGASVSVAVSGQVIEDTAIDTVLVNGEAALLNGSTFSAQVTLHPGVNPIQVIAIDRAGNRGLAPYHALIGAPAYTARIAITPATARVGDQLTFTALVTSTSAVTATVLFPLGGTGIQPVAGDGLALSGDSLVWHGQVGPGAPVTLQWRGQTTRPFDAYMFAVIEIEGLAAQVSNRVALHITGERRISLPIILR